MQEEDIQEHGLTTNEDHARMISNVEGMGFDPQYIHIVRLLFRIDTLRENEVYYLPRPGEVEWWKKKPRQDLPKLSTKENHSSSSRKSTRSPSTFRSPAKHPLSKTDSVTSTAGAAIVEYADEDDHESTSSTSILSSDSDYEEQPTKKRKGADAENNAGSPIMAATPPVVEKKRKPRRRGLPVDAAEYDPSKDTGVTDSEDDKPTRHRRKSTTGKGQKRTRAMAAEGENPSQTKEEHEAKKRKVEVPTNPQLHPQPPAPAIAPPVPEIPLAESRQGNELPPFFALPPSS